MREEIENACPPLPRVCGPHGNQFYLKLADISRAPRLADRITFQKTEKSEALKTAKVEEYGARAGTLRTGQQHVAAQRLIAVLGLPTCTTKGVFGAAGSTRFVRTFESLGLSGFFFRRWPGTARWYAGAQPRLVPRTNVLRSKRRSVRGSRRRRPRAKSDPHY